jgi:hypothetical protein
MIIGRGHFKYQVNADGAKLPEGWSLKGAGGRRSAVTPTTMSYVSNRGEHPTIVFVRDVNFLRSEGEGQYRTPTASIWVPTIRSTRPTGAGIS